jgi:hypothetical protein
MPESRTTKTRRPVRKSLRNQPERLVASKPLNRHGFGVRKHVFSEHLTAEINGGKLDVVVPGAAQIRAIVGRDPEIMSNGPFLKGRQNQCAAFLPYFKAWVNSKHSSLRLAP